MFSTELQILKVEGLDAGTVCKVMLDNVEVPMKNSQFRISRQGVVSLEFSKNKNYQGGVLFSSDLLLNTCYQYIPIYNPAVYIDNFPMDIEPPRVLVIQPGTTSLESSVVSSRCENFLEESLETTKYNRCDFLERQNSGLKIDADYFKKVILNEKNIQQAKLEDLQTYLEVTNFKNLMTMKNKDFVIRDLQTAKENTEKKKVETPEITNVLLGKIEKDAQKIGELLSEKNELQLKVKLLEQENNLMKSKYLQQEMVLKTISVKEKLLRKELECQKLFEKLTDGRVSERLMERNSLLQSRLEEYQQESQNFKEKFENTEQSYKVLKECLLGSDFENPYTST